MPPPLPPLQRTRRPAPRVKTIPTVQAELETLRLATSRLKAGVKAELRGSWDSLHDRKDWNETRLSSPTIRGEDEEMEREGKVRCTCVRCVTKETLRGGAATPLAKRRDGLRDGEQRLKDELSTSTGTLDDGREGEGGETHGGSTGTLVSMIIGSAGVLESGAVRRDSHAKSIRSITKTTSESIATLTGEKDTLRKNDENIESIGISNEGRGPYFTSNGTLNDETLETANNNSTRKSTAKGQGVLQRENSIASILADARRESMALKMDKASLFSKSSRRESVDAATSTEEASRNASLSPTSTEALNETLRHSNDHLAVTGALNEGILHNSEPYLASTGSLNAPALIQSIEDQQEGKFGSIVDMTAGKRDDTDRVHLIAERLGRDEKYRYQEGTIATTSLGDLRGSQPSLSQHPISNRHPSHSTLPTRIPDADLFRSRWTFKKLHPDCFVCIECVQPLHGKFYGRGDKPYCEPCWGRIFCPKCHACGDAIREKTVLAMNKPFHSDCFRCSVCEKGFTALSQFIVKRNTVFCVQCYRRTHGRRCVKCREPCEV
ncbi:hypothetical protein BC829DRAFT_396582 [Chytridium lagenaria]|nr:hypothetical protein BC829DRAFT_396582 [Chytridium lagenaria]